MVISLKKDQSASVYQQPWRIHLLYIEGRWMRKENVVVGLMDTVKSAELRDVAQCTAYIYLCCQCPFAP